MHVLTGKTTVKQTLLKCFISLRLEVDEGGGSSDTFFYVILLFFTQTQFHCFVRFSF